MNEDQITEWLCQRLKTQARLNVLGGVATLLGGLAILAATWGLTYLVSLVAIGPWLGYRHWIHSAIGLFFVPALFWGNARTSREYLSEYSVSVGTVSDTVVSFYLPGVGMASNVNPLAPDTIHSGAKMITDVLYTGPRVVVAGFRALRKARRIRQMDVASCGAVVTALWAAKRRLSFQEIVDATGLTDPGPIFSQIRDIEGVLFLQREPAGLALSQELRQELTQTA